ncbi:MAG: ABC transporter permease, partial [Candidatus Nanohalobium sp.]
MIMEYAKMSYRNIFRRKRRTALTVIGIFIGISAVVALVSLGQGLESSIQKEFQSIGGNKIFINPGGSLQTSGGQVVQKLDSRDIAAVNSVKGIRKADGALFMNTGVSYGDQSKFLPIIGIPPGQNKNLVMESWAMEMDKGRMIRENDRSNVVLGSKVADRVFNDDIGIRSKITVNGKEHRVVGVLKPVGDPSIDTAIILTIGHARDLMDRDKTYDWIFAEVEDGFDPGKVKPDVETALRRERGLKKGEETFTVSTQEDLVNSFQSILSVVRGVVIGIASISLFVGAVGIMNTMYTSVSQRTREIGVMKAIGAQNHQVMMIFLMESGSIGLLGGLTGLIFGLALSWTASIGASQFASLTIRPYLGPDLLLGSLVFSTVLGILSGVLPARRAAGLEPAEALRY